MLSTQQLTALKTAIDADPLLAAHPMNADGHFAIAAALNFPVTPAFIVWRTQVAWDEIMLNGMDWTRVDNLSVGKSRIWEWMFKNSSQSFNPSKPTIRQGIDTIWVGTAADLAVRAAVYVHCKRPATRAEKLLATGDGTTTVPATLTFEGALSFQDVEAARQS